MSRICGLGMTLCSEDMFEENNSGFNIFTATQDIFSTQNGECLPQTQSVVSNFTQVSSYFSPPKNQTQKSQFFQISQPFQNSEFSQNFNTQNEELFKSQVEEELNFLHQNTQTILNEDSDFLNSQPHENFLIPKPFIDNESQSFEFTHQAPHSAEIKTPFKDQNIFQSQLDLFRSTKSVQSSVPSTIISVNELIELDEVPIPQTIINMYMMIRTSYSDWVFIYALTAQLCSEVFPTGTYFNLKQSLLLSIASINGSVPPLQIIALGRNTSDANIVMNLIGNLSER